MQRDYRKWKSPLLGQHTGRDAEIVIHGEGGTPIIVLPTLHGDEREWEENGLLSAMNEQLEFEYNQIWCLGNPFLDPSSRGASLPPLEHIHSSTMSPVAAEPASDSAGVGTAKGELTPYAILESFVLDEILPMLQKQNPSPYVMIAGAREGGSSAIRLAFQNPDVFQRVISLSGTLPSAVSGADVNGGGASDAWIHDLFTDKTRLGTLDALDIRLIHYANDPMLERGRAFHEQLELNFVAHQFTIWDRNVHHPWRLWAEMFREHIL